MNLLILLVIYVVCSVNGHNDILTTLVGPCHRLPSGSFARDVEDCQNYFLCKNGHTIRGKCPDNLVFDAPNQRCEYPEDVTCFSCPKNEVYSLLPVERTCHQFYQCWMGIATIHSCPRSLVFDPKLRRCNFPIGTGCDGDEQVEEGCPAVDGSNPVYLRHATSCTAYYVCSKGTPLERQCAQGLHFNPRLRICDLPSEANCRIEGEDPEGSGSNEGGDGGGGGDGSDLAIPCPEKGAVFQPHKDNCNAYFACVNGQASLINCAPGLHFDYERGTCDRVINAKCWSRENPPLPPSVGGYRRSDDN